MVKPIVGARYPTTRHALAAPFPKARPLTAPPTPPHSRPCARRVAAAATAANEEDTEKLSDEYTDVMSARMGTHFVYRHEDGMNYNRILDDLIVGSCLQVEADVDTLAEREGVRTVLCLQENSDMAYFSLDVAPIRARCRARCQEGWGRGCSACVSLRGGG